ncbi:prolyl oligopeptidase family serine peptidase [soil metagenome]
MLSARSVSFFIVALAVSPAFAQKKPLDHSVYDGWRSIRNVELSRDGKWIAYVYTPQEGDAMAEIKSVDGATTLTVPRASSLRFTADSKFAVATVVPPLADTKKARRDKVKPEDQPKNALAIVDLGAKKVESIERVAQWWLATDDKGILLYRPEPPKPEPKKDAPPLVTPKPEEPKKEEVKKADEKPKKKADHKPGTDYVARYLVTGKEERIPDVASAVWSKDGSALALSISTKDGAGDGVWVRRYSPSTLLATEEAAKGMGRYTKLVLTNDGKKLAFLTDRDDYAAKKPMPSLYAYEAGKAGKVEAPKNPDGFLVNDDTTPRFSDSGRRLFFGIGPKPVEDMDVPDDEKVSLDIWNWMDPELQPQQVLQQKSERARTYDCVRLTDRKIVQLETPTRRNVRVADKEDGAVGLSVENYPYRRQASWGDDLVDIALVDIETGAVRPVVSGWNGSASLSTRGRYLLLTDAKQERVYTVDTKHLDRHEITGLPILFDELDDHPDVRSPYGTAGWTKDDAGVLVKDRYDVWLVDPSGKTAPRRITDGRPEHITSSRIDLTADDPTVDVNDLWWLRFDNDDKRAGFRHVVNGRTVAEVRLSPKSFAGFEKAKDADTFVYTQQDIREYPDLQLTTTALTEPKKITDANPQIKDYNWLTADLMEWTTNDGETMKGIVFKPENFDPAKRYPMIAYFYERNSDTLYSHRVPAPSASTINIPLFVSQGYVVFVPDIPYKIGYPGESAASAIISGVNALADRGYIDRKHMGIQGQSWGGYQVAYLVTETDMFAAAGAGAPVSDMFSAYGGIRYGSGVVRESQYEHGQSRIGGTPWNDTLKYIENSPLFFLPKVNTPLLIMSNDQDGAVPHTQGIELFTGLRRLNKPAWMLVYNGEDHNLVQRKNRKDLSIRLSQFFDYYLKGAPEPVWMSKGLPAVDKGRTMGTETGS